MNESTGSLNKRETGVPGLDPATHGGLPVGSTVLVLGQSGAGKTILSLQVLANAIARGEGGVMVSFEESPAQIRRDAASFSWGEALGNSDRLAIIDARPASGMETAGGFDVTGLLASVGAAAERVGAQWIVLDGIDQLLERQPDLRTAIDQVRDIDDWSEARQVTTLLTGKLTRERDTPMHLEGAEFLLPVTLVLSARLVERRLARRFRIAKYRASAHTTGDMALILDDDGVHLPFGLATPADINQAAAERASLGIARLDEVLGGGPHRGSTTLVSGRPGTAKTTLAGGFAEAAAARGERVLYLSFDEIRANVIRNLASVGIDLRTHVDSGHLRFYGREAWSSLAEEHYMAVLRLLDESQPDCLVIDPVSALLKAASADSAFIITERLLSEARGRLITTLVTSLTTSDRPESEHTLSHVSTIADTWIALDYNVRGGERNRSLSVVKSRGAAHSNQVRELVLSADGVELADVYEFGSEVLMGTARMQKESEVEAEQRQDRRQREQRRLDLQRRIEQARHEADRLEQELELDNRDEDARDHQARQHQEDVQRRRYPDRASHGTGTGSDPGGSE